MPPLKIGHDLGAATPGRDTASLPEGRSLARFGRIDRRNLGSIDFDVVGPKQVGIA